MDTPTGPQDRNRDSNAGFAAFLIKRVVVVTLLILVVLWALATGIDYLDKPAPWKDRLVKDDTGPTAAPAAMTSSETANIRAARAANPHGGTPVHASQGSAGIGELAVPPPPANTDHRPVIDGHLPQPASPQVVQPHQVAAPSANGATPSAPPAPTAAPAHGTTSGEGAAPKAEPGAHAVAPPPKPLPKGVTFIDAVIKPLSHELNERFWGWRPNDIINVTDNVNNYQLGVLEVTRRAVVQLTERISRTGSTDTINRKLENAMNWLMIKADSYWFPSPEAKYKDSLTELAAYRTQLISGGASFYVRADNIIPLLMTFEDLLGSCDENLVKAKEKDGSSVGFFTADNYFYYAKGVAAAMGEILEAVAHDFDQILITRHGEELLHHAVVSCQLAASLDPWLIINSDLDGFLANHRANMAAPISHARYYLGQLIKTLST